MRDLLIIPTFSRPEMLWNCLEHVARCPEASELEIRIVVDAHNEHLPPREDIEAVADEFSGLDLALYMRAPHSYHGNSYNVMMAYAAAQDRRFVFMVEDDVMVEPDFFAWHYDQHATRPLFCSVGVENTRSGQFISADDYASLGVCFPKQSIGWIAQHAREAYFADMRGYCERVFGGMFASEDVEQDGLIIRIMGTVGGLSAWPDKAKAKHVGWYGYHRPNGRPQGTLEQRYKSVKEQIAVGAKIR